MHEEQRNGIRIIGEDANEVNVEFVPVAVLDGGSELRDLVYFLFVLSPDAQNC